MTTIATGATPRAEAPLYIHASEVARWLLAHLPGDGALVRRIHRDALDLHDDVVLALRERDRDHRLRSADATLVLLRAHLRLLHELGQLADHQLVHVTGLLDGIGRQLGGWLRRLEHGRPASADAPGQP